MTNLGLPIKGSWVISTNKKERARVIVDYAKAHFYEGIVVFSIGNPDDLKRSILRSSLNLISVSPDGDLQSANKWWSQEEIRASWPSYFDATSGHLPIFLINKIVNEIRNRYWGLNEGLAYYVPTGSGETFVCMAIAFPKVAFRAVYNIDRYTQWNPNAPLNALVESLANEVHYTMPKGFTHPAEGKQKHEAHNPNESITTGPTGLS